MAKKYDSLSLFRLGVNDDSAMYFTFNGKTPEECLKNNFVEDMEFVSYFPNVNENALKGIDELVEHYQGNQEDLLKKIEYMVRQK